MRFRHDLFLRCARGGCPDCGAAGQLKGLATIPDRCTACGMVLRRREGFFLGAMVWNYGLTAFGLLAFAVGLFIVHSAIGLAFEQRRPVIRTLRAVGLPLRTLVLLMVVERVEAEGCLRYILDH